MSEHYREGDIECIDAIRAALTPEEFRGFCKGNIIKYTWRERAKGGDQDLIKLQDYAAWAVQPKTSNSQSETELLKSPESISFPRPRLRGSGPLSDT
jgi:hypothetical protein